MVMAYSFLSNFSEIQKEVFTGSLHSPWRWLLYVFGFRCYALLELAPAGLQEDAFVGCRVLFAELLSLVLGSADFQ